MTSTSTPTPPDPGVGFGVNCTPTLTPDPDFVDLFPAPFSNSCSSDHSQNASSPSLDLPPAFHSISDLSLGCVIAYSILFLISSGGNISVFFSVLRQLRATHNRISLLILHLCIADLIVTFTAMPMEIVWRITIQWYGGDFLCKLCQFLRAFGLYLSSMVVICISLDRYFAIIYPLKLARAAERAKITLALAWAAAGIFAAPQTIIFHVESHPDYPTFRQCVTESFLRSDVEQELVYNVFSVSVLYFIPLLIILFTYFRIVSKISAKSSSRAVKIQEGRQEEENQRRCCSSSYHIHQNSGKKDCPESRASLNGRNGVPFLNDGQEMTEVSFQPSHPVLGPVSSLALGVSGENTSATASSGRKLFLRTSISGGVLMARARIKTLRLTCVIVLTFILCWSPYVFMTLWYMIDRDGAKNVDKRLQEGLFLMAVSNSVMNPLIYGTYGTSNCNCGLSGKHRPTARRGQPNQNPSPSSAQRQSVVVGGTGGPPTMTSVILTHHLYNQNGVGTGTSVI